MRGPRSDAPACEANEGERLSVLWALMAWSASSQHEGVEHPRHRTFNRDVLRDRPAVAARMEPGAGAAPAPTAALGRAPIGRSQLDVGQALWEATGTSGAVLTAGGALLAGDRER